MSEMVSSLYSVTLGGGHYIIIVVNESNYATKIQKLLLQQAQIFGEQAGVKAKIVRSYPRASERTFQQVKKKQWPAEVRDRIDADEEPFLIFIKSNFREFDPAHDEWFILWLSKQRAAEKTIPSFFHKVDGELKRSADFFEFLRTKLDGSDREFPPGCLSTRDHPGAPPKPRRRGRDKIHDEKPEVTIKRLVGLIAQFKIEPGERGWKIELARREKQEAKPSFTPKSISDDLTKTGIFKEILKRNRLANGVRRAAKRPPNAK
jgi:hypothetical protein